MYLILRGCQFQNVHNLQETAILNNYNNFTIVLRKTLQPNEYKNDVPIITLQCRIRSMGCKHFIYLKYNAM